MRCWGRRRPRLEALSEDEQEHRRAEAAALQGREVPFDLLAHMPDKTMHARGMRFQQLRSLAKSARAASVCCLPVASPVGKVATIW